MASLLRTKPKWCKTVEATEQGWVNTISGELLVSLRGLKSKLEAETEVVVETKTEEVNVSEEIVIKEQTIKKPKKSQKILAEVVEYDLEDKTIVGE